MFVEGGTVPLWRFLLQIFAMAVGIVLMVGIWLLAQVLAPHGSPSLSKLIFDISVGNPESLVFFSGAGIALFGFGFFVRDIILGYQGK